MKILAFQATWLTCALGAAAGMNWPGVAAAAALTAWHLATRPKLLASIAVPLAAGLLGGAAETALVAAGFVSFNAPPLGPLPIPAWIVALWVAFATTLPVLAAWFGPNSGPGWPWKAAALGLVGGPLAYIAGERLGALTLAPASNLGWWTAAAAIATAWAVSAPLLMWLQSRIDPASRP